MVLFNNIPYKRMHLTSKVNFTKHFSKKYKCMCLITRLYGILAQPVFVRFTFVHIWYVNTDVD